jgi:hypothetical protein
MRSYTGLTGGLPYWAALDGSGALHEWYGENWNHRSTTLDFEGRALSIDPSATRYRFEQRRESEGGKHDAQSFGPVVLYIAGPGRIERRIMPAFERGAF